MTRPPQHVLEAFGVADPSLLPGGRGRAWAAGDLVLKPLDLLPEELAWQGRVLRELDEDGFRVAPPEPQIVDGWTAWRRVDGTHVEGRWLDTIAVGERLHAALARFDRPAFLDERTHPWSVGDRAAWGELPPGPWADVAVIARLTSALAPVDAPSSLIHGDLTGNVLYADGLPPAVIDLSPFWRPAEYASAIVVADALVWEGADESLADVVEPQFLVRALIFRAVTEHVVRGAVDPAYDRAARLCV